MQYLKPPLVQFTFVPTFEATVMEVIVSTVAALHEGYVPPLGHPPHTTGESNA